MNGHDTDPRPQFLIRTADGRDYARVEPWQGGLVQAMAEARRIRGYVVELDEHLCRYHPDRIPAGADFRAPWPPTREARFQ